MVEQSRHRNRRLPSRQRLCYHHLGSSSSLALWNMFCVHACSGKAEIEHSLIQIVTFKIYHVAYKRRENQALGIVVTNDGNPIIPEMLYCEAFVGKNYYPMVIWQGMEDSPIGAMSIGLDGDMDLWKSFLFAIVSMSYTLVQSLTESHICPLFKHYSCCYVL